MSMKGSKGSPQPKTEQNAHAALSREMYEDYRKRFLPIEQDLAAEVAGEGKMVENVAKAGVTANQSYDQAADVFQRSASRHGITLDGDMQAETKGRQQRGKVLNFIDARNRMRDSTEGRNSAVKKGLVSSGRNLSGMAMSNQGAVAGGENSRNNTNRQLEQMDQANKMEGIGQVAGLGLTMLCWVARAVYGEESPRWRLFRRWLLTMGPAWLLRAYGQYGERIAAFIQDKPLACWILRKLMDRAIGELPCKA